MESRANESLFRIEEIDESQWERWKRSTEGRGPDRVGTDPVASGGVRDRFPDPSAPVEHKASADFSRRAVAEAGEDVLVPKP